MYHSSQLVDLIGYKYRTALSHFDPTVLPTQPPLNRQVNNCDSTMAESRTPAEPQPKSFEKPSETTPLLGSQDLSPPSTSPNPSSLVPSEDSTHRSQSSEYRHHGQNNFKVLERGAILRIVLVLLIGNFLLAIESRGFRLR